MKDKIVTKVLSRYEVPELQIYTVMAITIVAAISWLISLGFESHF